MIMADQCTLVIIFHFGICESSESYLLNVNRGDNAKTYANWSDDSQDYHVDDDLNPLDTIWDHFHSNTEDDCSAVDGNC